MKKFAVAAAFVALALTGAAKAAVTVTPELAGVQNTTANLAFKGVETFDNASAGGFTSQFGSNGYYQGVYSLVVPGGKESQLRINGADVYGGAGGDGKYAVTFEQPGYQLDFSTSAHAVNYFGLWISAIDDNNSLKIYSGGQTYDFSPPTLISQLNASYFNNPNANQHWNAGEKYVFVNFQSTAPIEKIVFGGFGGGFESDNHTVGFAAVPEPATWAMMIIGFGAIGSALRSNRRRAALAA